MDTRNQGKQHAVDVESPPANDLVKRRKVRKGTTSCWECKKRKKRCEVRSRTSSTCALCERNGIPCVSQELPEAWPHSYKSVEQRIDQIEALVNHLVHQREEQSNSRTKPNAMVQERSAESRSADTLTTFNLKAVGHERLSRAPSLTGYLSSILPHPAIATVILGNSKLFKSPLQVSQRDPSNPSSLIERLTGIYNLLGKAHPVMFAQILIQLALCLRHCDTVSAQQLALRMNESIEGASKRFFMTACHFVMSQDYLIGSLEGLETLILQSRYYTTIGDSRTAWLVYRRASKIANAIGLTQLAHNIGERAESVIFQLIYSDRFLSLSLGLPFLICEYPRVSADRLKETAPAQCVERIHVQVAGRIISRNLRLQGHESRQWGIPLYQHHDETKLIDSQLKKATKLLPTSWWCVPTLHSGLSDNEVSERTASSLLQLHQCYLLLLLHQPYLLQVLPKDTRVGEHEKQHDDYVYSKLAAISASREVTSRYLMLRMHHRSLSYRALDEKAFTAAITLLFAHLDGHRVGGANVLEHQRSQDLGMLERVINLMEELSPSTGDLDGNLRVQILRNFFQVESHAADGLLYDMTRHGHADGIDQRAICNHERGLQIPVPYFGNLCISPGHSLNARVAGSMDDCIADISGIITEPSTASLSVEPSDQVFHLQESPSKGSEDEWYNAWIREPSFTDNS